MCDLLECKRPTIGCLMTKLATILQIRGRPDVPDHVVEEDDPRPLHPVTLATVTLACTWHLVTVSGPGVGHTVHCPHGVRHQVHRHWQLSPGSVWQQTVCVCIQRITVTEGVTIRLLMTSSWTVRQRWGSDWWRDQGVVMFVQTMFLIVTIWKL